MVVVTVWWARVGEVGDPARDLLRAAVAERAGCESSAVDVARLCPECASADHGRPVVVSPTARPWRVSLSRARGLVAVAVTEGCDVGIDVEEVARTSFAGFPAVALHPQERDGTPAERGLIWTRKEALLKATGTGLGTDPRSIRVSPPDEPPRVEGGLDAPAGQRISLHTVSVPNRYAATLAVVSGAASTPAVTVRQVGVRQVGVRQVGARKVSVRGAAPGASPGRASDGRGRREPHPSGRPPTR